MSLSFEAARLRCSRPTRLLALDGAFPLPPSPDQEAHRGV